MNRYRRIYTEQELIERKDYLEELKRLDKEKADYEQAQLLLPYVPLATGNNLDKGPIGFAWTR